VKSYGKIVGPLTSLLKNNSFVWNDVATQSFTYLKDAMCTTPVLSMPKFNKIFVLKSDALCKGVGVVLM
jgi:hypothetical protein